MKHIDNSNALSGWVWNIGCKKGTWIVEGCNSIVRIAAPSRDRFDLIPMVDKESLSDRMAST